MKLSRKEQSLIHLALGMARETFNRQARDPNMSTMTVLTCQQSSNEMEELRLWFAHKLREDV